jgi:hypothetical protein
MITSRMKRLKTNTASSSSRDTQTVRGTNVGQPDTSAILQELTQLEGSFLLDMYRGWKRGSPGAIPRSQTTRVETTKSGAVISIALLHRKEHDPFGNHREPHYIDLVYTKMDARRNGHGTSLLKRLVDEEHLEMTAFVLDKTEAAFRKAGFVQLVDTPHLAGFVEQMDIPDDQIPTLWRSM